MEATRSDCLEGKIEMPSFYATCTDLAETWMFQSWQGSVFAKVPQVHFLAETKNSYVQFPKTGATGTALAGKGSDYKTYDTK